MSGIQFAISFIYYRALSAPWVKVGDGRGGAYSSCESEVVRLVQPCQR